MGVYALSKEIISRILSIVFFPIAFIMRDKIRTHLNNVNQVLVEERTWRDTQDTPTEYFYKAVNKFYFFLWLFLDDSPASSSYHENGKRMYDASDSDEHYPKWVLKTNKFWIRATWWSFIRNNTVNYVSWFRTTGWNTDKVSVETYWGKFGLDIDKTDNNFRYVPGMYLVKIKHNNGKWYPYFTYVGEIFGKKIGIWQGRSKGSGRFSFSVRM
jgi:hypothetical protein